MTFNVKALSQALGDDQWLARINPPYKEQTLHHQLLTSVKVSNPTAKKSFGFGVTATKQQRLPTKRFYLENAALGANAIKYINAWNDPNLSCLERLQILQKQVVTAALIVTGDETNPYITFVTNPSITKIDVEDDANFGAPFWADFLSEELAYKMGVPYNRSSHLVAAGTGWSTRTGEVSSREDLIDKIQAVLLHPAERFGTHQDGIHHVLLLPELICPPVGFFWPAKTTYSEFVASIKTLNGTAYRSFLTVLELCRSTIEPWLNKVNASPKDFCFRMQSAQPLINALPTKENPIPEGIEDESLLDPILELVDQLLWAYYEDRVLTDCESKESSTHAASQLHYFLQYGQKCFPESLKSIYGSRIPFLSYFLRPSKRWMMGVDHGSLFSNECHQAQWIQRYSPIAVPVIVDESYISVTIRTKLELAIEKATESEPKVISTDHSDLNSVEETIPKLEAPTALPQQDKEKRLVPAVLVRNVGSKDDIKNLSRCFVNRIKDFTGEEAEVVSCHVTASRKGTVTVFLEFTDLQHAKLALTLNGTQLNARIISVQLMQPGVSTAAIDVKHPTSIASKSLTEVRNDKYKIELCTRYESRGSCYFGDKCGFAHGVLDLRLHQTTHLHPKRCLYVSNIVRNYPPSNLMHFIRKKYEQSVDSRPEFTAIHLRGRLGDALVEFKDSSQASVARQVLDGISLVNLPLQIRSWRPEYQRPFLAYFQEDRDIPIEVANFGVPQAIDASSETSYTNSVNTREQRRILESLQQLLSESQQELNELQERKQAQDLILGLVSESFDSMKLGLSTALREIDAVMQHMVKLQEAHAKLSNSSHGTDNDAGKIQKEIERLQRMIAHSKTDESGRSSSLLSAPREIGGEQMRTQSYSNAVERSFHVS